MGVLVWIESEIVRLAKDFCYFGSHLSSFMVSFCDHGSLDSPPKRTKTTNKLQISKRLCNLAGFLFGAGCGLLSNRSLISCFFFTGW